MNRLLLAGFLLSLVASGSGCAVCSHPWDYAYAAYGGKLQRADQFNGRVNSVFEPAGGEFQSGDEVIVSEGEVSPYDEGDLEPTADMTGR